MQIDVRWAASNVERARKPAAELLALAPDVILTSGGSPLVASQQATRTVPIVFTQLTDPVGSGFVESLARPGANVTGFTLFEFNTSGKWLGGLVITPHASAIIHRDLIVKLAARHRLPTVYFERVFVAAGGLISYGPDQIDQFRRAAGYVDRILRGEKPANLPVQAPTKYELVINLKTAKTLGLEITPMLLARADEVIE